MSGIDVPHGIEGVAIFVDAVVTDAIGTDRLARAIEAARVPEREIVAELVGGDPQLIVAVTPCLIRRADVSKSRPAAGAVVRHDVKAVLVVGKGVARRGGRAVRKAGDRGVVAVRGCCRTRQKPTTGGGVSRATCGSGGLAGHGDVEQLSIE